MRDPLRPQPAFVSTLRVLVPFLFVACNSALPESERAAPPLPVTNGTVTFHTPRKEGLDRAVTVSLVAAKPTHRPLQNGGDGRIGIDGCKEFPAGTTPAGIVAYYKVLLAKNGWTESQDFVASGNSLHFYGISQLGGGSGHSQLSVNGATDSGDVPYRDTAPAAR